MAKTNITQYDATAGNNTDIDSIDIAEGMAPSNVNNAIRELMAHLKDVDAGTVALTLLKATEMQTNDLKAKDSNTLNLGVSGDTLTVPSGATLSVPSGATLTVAGTLGGSIIQPYDADTAKLDVTQVFTKAQIPSTYTGTGLTLDFDTYQNFIITLASGSNSLANPTTEASNVGQCGVIIFIQPSSSSAGTVSLGSDYETAAAGGLTLSTANNDYDVVPYCIKATDSILLGSPQLNFG